MIMNLWKIYEYYDINVKVYEYIRKYEKDWGIIYVMFDFSFLDMNLFNLMWFLRLR